MMRAPSASQAGPDVDGRGGSFKSEANAIVSYLDAQQRQAAHPLVLLSAFILDLLAIHPVADGNGRLARLVTARELLQVGYESGRRHVVFAPVSAQETPFMTIELVA